MPVEKSSKGTGLTQTDHYQWGTGDWEDPEAKRLTRLNTLEGRLQDIEAACAAILRAAELPSAIGWYTYTAAGDWRPMGVGPPDEPAAGFTSSIERIATLRRHKWDGPEGFAARMMDDLRDIRNHQAEGNSDDVALSAFFLGVKWAASGIKSRHSEKTRTGPTKEIRDTNLARIFLDRRGSTHLSPTALKVEIGAKEGLGRSQSIDAIDRGLRILSGDSRNRTDG